MTDEPSTRELARRLDEILRLLQGLVSRAEYTADQRHSEHRFNELEHDILEKRHAHDEDVRELRTELNTIRDQLAKTRDSSGVNFRQAVYSGLIPAILLLVTLLVGFLQIKGK